MVAGFCSVESLKERMGTKGGGAEGLEEGRTGERGGGEEAQVSRVCMCVCVCVFERFVTHACRKAYASCVARSHSLCPTVTLSSHHHLHRCLHAFTFTSTAHRPLPPLPPSTDRLPSTHSPSRYYVYNLPTATFPRTCTSSQDLNNFRNTVGFFQPSVMFCQGMNVIDGEKMPDTKDGEKARTVMLLLLRD